jgi:hypothetical protein
MLLKLTDQQIKFLTGFNNCVYVKISGILYMRYLANPKDLWDLLSPFLCDESVFYPTVDKKEIRAVGEYVEHLLKESDHYGTRLPRIPTQIDREIKGKLMIYHEAKRRNERGNADEMEEGYLDDKHLLCENQDKSRSPSSSRSNYKEKRRHDKHRSRSRSRSRSRKRHNNNKTKKEGSTKQE